ncbi:serine/threonine protein kinase [Minicystis rosea]|nr:serine/threonine protein kinase [Minicystis rosea]
MLKPGETFARYTIEAPIGQGGMGAVYRAHDARLGRRVALKVISEGAAGAEADARLLREARAAAALDHPNAVAIFDVGEHEGATYIVMELVEGRTLRAFIGDTSVPQPTRIARLADVARALSGAHRRGLVHRDVKPENVMVRDDGMVKVLDFGIARRTRGDVDATASTEIGDAVAPALPTLTAMGVKVGTPMYMAPEQIRGDALDGRTDQFSWGVLAYELLTGRLPWRGGGDALAVMASVLTDAADRAPLEQANVPRAVQDVVLRALEKRPDDRFASLDDAVRALDDAARGEASPRLEPAPSATDAQRFSTTEIHDVLARAVEQQAAKQGSTKLGFEELLAIAAEVGVDEASLREASRALRTRNEAPPADLEKAKERDAWLRGERRNFYRHAGIYVIVNAALLVLGVILQRFTPFWIWLLPPLAWGVGLAIHGLVALTTTEDDWVEHERGIEWWRENRRRRHELALARANEAHHGAESRAEARAARRGRMGPPHRRIEPQTPPDAARDRVRVATDSAHLRAAEDEAAAVAEAPDRARRR